MTLDVDGRLDPDGGFTLTAPLREQGRSGDSDIQVKAEYVPAGGSNKSVDIAIDSTVFYLNDILNTLNSIAGKQRAAPSEERKPAATDGSPVAEQERQAPDLKPDERAFWDTTDYDARVKFRLDRLFYTDYLEFRDIQGHAALLPDKLELGDFSTHFHDSPITLDGRMTFASGETPYDLKLRAGVEQFDLARFFRELVPGSTPRAEGLFDVSLDAFGASPNLSQYRNKLYFDMRLQSRDGIFRPFDPDSALLAGSSGIAGAFGSVVSNLPTGLFGLGAVSRLVNYMKEIEYDKIAIHLVTGCIARRADQGIRRPEPRNPDDRNRRNHLPGRRRYRRQPAVHGGQDRHARARRRHPLQPGPAAVGERRLWLLERPRYQGLGQYRTHGVEPR